MMPRAVPEWQGKTAEAMPPPRVRQRLYDRAKGNCHLCGQPVKPGWHADHIKALINGGENRESNLAPAHPHCHAIKTAQDVKDKAKVAAVRGKHTGAIRSKGAFRTAPKPEKPPSKIMQSPRRSFYLRRTTEDQP